MKKLLILSIILLLGVPAFADSEAVPPNEILRGSEAVPEGEIYAVERVIDGDTLKLTNSEQVQLIGIDTPESRPNDKAKRDSERTGQDLETINKTEMGSWG